MPRLNGMGPMGQGPMTGRGMGNCGGGMRRGSRFGFGCRRFISPKNEIASLDEQEKMLKEELAIIQEEKKAIADQEK